MKFIKKLMRKGGGFILPYLLGVFTADLVKPQLEKIPVVGDLVGKIDDTVDAINPATETIIDEEEQA